MFFLLFLILPFSVIAWNLVIDGLARLRAESKAVVRDSRDLQFTVLIPAHNEEACISGVLKSLDQQTYDHFSAYVVADCCTDDTKKIVSRFPKTGIIEKTSPSTCKGDALNHALRILAAELGDAVVILDADCTVNREFLEKLNDQYRTGSKAVMADTDILNPYKSIVTGWYAIYWKMVSEMSRKGHAKLGLSGNLCGCGMSFRREYLRETETITEDVEYFMALGCEDIRIDYAPEAKVFQEQPSTLKNLFRQLYRWMSGVRSVNKLYLKRLLCSIARDFRFRKLDVFMTSQVCSAYGLLTGLLFLYILFAHFFRPEALPILGILLIVYYLIILAIGITTARRCKLDHRIMVAAVPTYCIFTILMSLIYIYVIISPGKTWGKVDRGRKQ